MVDWMCKIFKNDKQNMKKKTTKQKRLIENVPASTKLFIKAHTHILMKSQPIIFFSKRSPVIQVSILFITFSFLNQDF